MINTEKNNMIDPVYLKQVEEFIEREKKDSMDNPYRDNPGHAIEDIELLLNEYKASRTCWVIQNNEGNVLIVKRKLTEEEKETYRNMNYSMSKYPIID